VKKSDRMDQFVDALLEEADAPPSPWPDCYRGYFICFNRQEYYEAHDVLEHLWLPLRSGPSPDAPFYKALIQMAGAFVHLQKQYLRPHHHKDGRRLAPAARLFALARHNLSAYPDFHLGLDLTKLRSLLDHYESSLQASHFTRNPWHPDSAPQLDLT
jgi:predicted metal-dependent hydrolase